MPQGDLTSVGNVKLWLGATTNTSDPLLGRLVSAVSGTVCGYLDRPYLGSALHTERYDGHGRDSLMLRHGPVTSVVSIAYGGSLVTTPATGNPPSGGYLIDSAYTTVGRITLTDDVFPRGRLGVLVSYWGGYLAGPETHVAAAIVQAALTWLTDVGVTYASGTALARVSGAPSVGQYAVTTSGAYTFAAADYGAAILLSYGTVPYDLEQAVIELVGEEYRRMDRVGLVAQTLAGQEIVSYSQAAMGASIKLALQRFRRVAAI